MQPIDQFNLFESYYTICCQKSQVPNAVVFEDFVDEVF